MKNDKENYTKLNCMNLTVYLEKPFDLNYNYLFKLY